jgi:hypothetical protein
MMSNPMRTDELPEGGLPPSILEESDGEDSPDSSSRSLSDAARDAVISLPAQDLKTEECDVNNPLTAIANGNNSKAEI